MDISNESLKMAKELGADLTINVKDNDKSENICNYLSEEKVDVVIISALTKENFDFAASILRKDGYLSIVAMH